MEINQKAPVRASAEVIIDAPVAVVWEVLSDIRNWPTWNHAVSTVSMFGDFEPLTDFHWKADGVTIISTLQEIEPQQRLLWTGRTPGIRATHLWQFDEQDGQTRVRTEETFEGLMARFLKGPLSKMLSSSLEQGVQSLKKESERRGQNSGE